MMEKKIAKDLLKIKAVFFRGVMKDGVLDVPPMRGKGVAR